MNKLSILVVLVLCTITFLLGRWSVPIKVEIQEKYVDRMIVKIDETKVQQLTQQISILQNELLTTRQSSTKVTHTVKRPDGTLEITSRVETDSETNKQNTQNILNNVSESTTSSKQALSDTLKQKELSKVQTKIEPQWHLMVMAGVQLDKLTIKPQAPYLDPVYIGVALDRRIIGPFYAGAWVVTNRSGGMLLGVEF